MSVVIGHAARRTRSLVATLLFACVALLLPDAAKAQHTSSECPAQTATVSSGGSVTINVTDCEFASGFGGIGPIDGGSFGAPDFENHGTASLRESGGQWLLDYSHNGSTGIGSTDVFEFSDGSLTGDGDVQVTITITPSASPITVSPATLPTLTAGTAFAQTLTSSGGVAPYNYTLQSGVLPAGLSLSSGGVLSGTPTQRGSYSFSVRSTDATAPTALFVDKGYTGSVQNPSLTLSTSAGTAIQGVAFSQTLSTTGGVAPHTYQLETGSFPAGISVSTAGEVSGTTAAAPGNYPVTLRVTDASTGPGSYFELESYTLTVSPPPSVSIAVSPASVSEDGATNLVYTVTRSLNLSSPTVVNITTGGTATAGIDYTGSVAAVTIPAGATTATITIDPTVDATVEANETVILTVAAGTGYTVGTPSSVSGTILNDDVPSASISVAPASVSEDGAPNLVYTITLNQAPLSATSVNFTVSGTATSGTDYAAVTSPLVIAAGSTTGTVTVNPTADATIEADETVVLTLNAGAGYTVGVPNSATGTILNDDLPTLSINDVTQNEGNAGTTNFTFTVSLSAPAGPGGTTFDIATANGTATAGVDYVASSLTAQTIPAGSSTYNFTVQVNGDALNEPSETFFVNVTNVTGAVVADGQGVGTITNDDPAPSLSINDVSVVEGNAGTTSAVFTVTLSAASGQAVTVNYATADGTAIAPADYTASSGTLSFAPGATTQTITVLVNGELVPEANETFFVNLSAAANATIADSQGVGTITNDDVPVTVNPATIPNGTVATAYSQTITASGGTAPYTYAVTAGTLPAGLSLSPVGTITGTPTAGGAVNFTITATDSSPFPGPFSGNQAYTLVIAPPTITLPATALPGGTLGAAYSTSLNPASGGTTPYSYAATAGALPPGLTLNAATGAITGTPTGLGTFNFTITATDGSTGSGPYSAQQGYAITVIDVAPTATNSSLTVAYDAPATNVPLSLGGGAAVSVAIGSAPGNGTASVSGTTITYQPNAGYAGPDSFTYTATNSGGTSSPATVTITVQDPVVTITAAGGFAASIAAPYTQTFTFNGGAQPWSGHQVTNLPAGVSITGTTANTVTISGTPTQAGSFNLNVSATDSSTGNGPYTVGQAFTLTVSAPALTMTPASGALNPAYGVPYSQTFTAAGGTGPYTYAVLGTLPAGVTFTGDTLSGTPTAPGSYAITITATDTGSTGTGAPFSVAQNYILNVSAPTITVSPATLPNATAGTAYAQTVTAAGGVAPYGFAVTAGALPTGMTLSNSGALSGTPSAIGTFNFTVTATDANGQTGSRGYTITLAAPVLTMTPAAGSLSATYGAAYSQTFTAGGSPGPYTYALTGALPAGVTFTGNTLSGTPTAPGTYPVTITATDTFVTGVGAPFSIAQSYTINVSAPTITVSPATLPNPTAGTAYAQTVTVSGGVAPYSMAVTAGALPGGITLSTAGALTGTSYQVGTFNFTVTATDANGQTGSRGYTVTLAAPVLTMTPAAGTLTAAYGAAYSQTFTAGGSPGPYTYALTGALPAGVTFTGNTLSGTPTVPGSYPVTITATDTVLTGAGAPFSIAQNYVINVPTPALTIAPSTLPSTTAGLAYSQTLSATGGVGPYAFTLTSGALPAGLSLSGAGVLSGTPTQAGTFNVSFTATDTHGQTVTAGYALVVATPTLTLSPAAGALPNATAGVAYSQALTLTGGIAPYTTTLTGALPTGLAFDPATLRFSGTPTQSGNFTVTVTVTDSTTGIPATTTATYTLQVQVPALSMTPDAVAGATAGVAYTQAFVASGGIAPYQYSLSAGTLPTGVALNASTGQVSGTPTQAGNFDFSVTATDSTTGTAATITRDYTLAVSAPTIVVDPETLPEALQSVAYDETLSARGGTAPYTFAVDAGALPAGMTLTGAGVLSGTPTATGLFNITIRATDALGFSGTRTYAFNVISRPDPTQDPEVRGLLDAQAEATRRFATGQITNFQQRLEQLHGGAKSGGSRNGLSFTTREQCPDNRAYTDMDACGTAARERAADARRDATGQPRLSGGASPDEEGTAAQADASAFGFWTGGTLRSGNFDGRSGRNSLDFETEGVSAGADRRFHPDLVAGLGLGYGQDSTSIGDNGTQLDGKAWTLAMYASYQPGERLFVDGLVGFQRLSYDLERFVTTNEALVRGSRDGDQWFASISVGSDFTRGTAQLTPYARLDAMRATLDPYTESGDPTYALTYGEQDVDTTTGNLGLRMAFRRSATWGAFSPQVRFEYQHDFTADSRTFMQYADLLGPTYATSVSGYDRSRFMLGLGVLFDFGAYSLQVDYRGVVGSSDQRDNALQLMFQTGR
ncbi:putative Ig domain-containing protein [Pseudoxanthomonas sp. Root630]|uniref:putative Ig domain-containing protein n=1 Tax=Pseudoxanthomonas sp. Root630 TaxID=1736574 RepID=UPI0007030857|nr:putative Ig domain-containing protein [Pseudoxanthomonas sp. Root630]KRA45202.1 hypothetical protein ASD72_08055 [Pseudoxanthomonas sp. Root630]